MFFSLSSPVGVWAQAAGTGPPAVESSRAPSSALVGPEHRLQGLYWDASLGAGLGLALGKPGASAVVAQGRLGALWANEPHSLAAGPWLALGGTSSMAVGGELEWNHLSGPFVGVASGYVPGGGLRTDGTAGFRFFGMQYQHRFFAGRPYHGLFALLRFPLGLWFAVEENAKQRLQVAAALRITPPKSIEPQDPMKKARAKVLVQSAAGHRAAGNGLEAARALRLALALHEGAQWWMLLSDVEEELGHLIQAEKAASRHLDRLDKRAEPAAVRRAYSRIEELRRRWPLLRVVTPAGEAGAVELQIDGQPCTAVRFGADCPMNPGWRRVRFRKPGGDWTDHRLEAREGQIHRLRIDDVVAADRPALGTGPAFGQSGDHENHRGRQDHSDSVRPAPR